MMDQSTNTSSSKLKKNLNVIYQRLAGRWFAFSIFKGEIFYGKIPEKAITPSDTTKSK